MGKILAKFLPPYTYKYNETTTDLPLELPKFSSPFTTSVVILFTPAKFIRIQ